MKEKLLPKPDEQTYIFKKMSKNRGKTTQLKIKAKRERALNEKATKA